MGGAARRSALGRWTLGVALAAAFAGCPDSPDVAPPPPPGPAPIAWIIEHKGKVTVERQGASSGASANLPLYSGDVISTGAAASALVRYSNRQEVEVSENTRFRLTATPTQLVVELEEGRIVTRGGDGGTGRLAIRAPGTSGELEMGDIVDITASGGTSRLIVTEGDIVLTSPDGGTIQVGKGESADFEMGEIRMAERPPAAGPLAVKLAAERGKVLLKAKQQKRFVPMDKDEVDLADGTAFRMPKTGRARLAGATGVKGQLIAAAGRLEAAAIEGIVERYTVGLDQGEIHFTFPGGVERRVQVKGAGKSLEITSTEPSTARVIATRKGPRLVVVAGKVAVGTSTVQAGQVVELDRGEPKVASLPKPSLILPSRRVRVYADDMPLVGLSVPDGSAAIEVASDSAFSQLVAQGSVDGSYLPFTPPARGELFWRALGKDGAALSKGHARFDRDPDESEDDIEHPRAEVAETGLKAVVYFQSVLPELTFAYAEREGAAGYRLRVYKSDDLKTPLWQREEKGITSTAPAGQIGEGQYLWYAAALNAQGAEIGGGRMNKLELVYDNSRRSLAIARPRQGEKVGETVETRGVAPIGSKLTVNGHAAQLDGKGRFKAEVPGSQFLVFRLLTDDGAESYWVRQVRSR